MTEKDNLYAQDPRDLYDNYLSFYDLSQHPEFLPAWKAQDKDKIEEILYFMGVDLTHGYEVQVCKHRSRIDAVLLDGPRWGFIERKDAEWVSTGMETETVIRNTGDREFSRDLAHMNERYKLGNILEGMAANKKRKDVSKTSNTQVTNQ
jgi:hypothetical protein